MKTSTAQISHSQRVPLQLLRELRTYLEHFNQTGHLGESDAVAAINSHLRARIVEVEAELARRDK
jgi:hypothetical protein